MDNDRSAIISIGSEFRLKFIPCESMAFWAWWQRVSLIFKYYNFSTYRTLVCSLSWLIPGSVHCVSLAFLILDGCFLVQAYV